jgi:hypothetical protein
LISVIPPLITVGLVAGLFPRRGWTAIPVTGALWSVILLATGVDSGTQFAILAALLGMANTTVGFVVALPVRLVRSRQHRDSKDLSVDAPPPLES